MAQFRHLSAASKCIIRQLAKKQQDIALNLIKITDNQSPLSLLQDNMSTNNKTIQSLERGFALLETLSFAESPLSLQAMREN